MKKCWCGNTNLSEYSNGYYKCDVCHTLISKHSFQEAVYDVENEEEDLYGKNYWEKAMIKAAGKDSLSEVVDMYLAERVIYWLKFVLKYVKLGADIAEVGCGLGQLQYVLKRIGYNQMAYELSPEICEYMEQELKVNAHCGPFSKKENAYDGILGFDLFEHLMEPMEFAKECFSSLRQDGVLCLQTPCYDSELSYNQMLLKKGKFEEQLKEEQHIYLYSRESITDILKNQGFDNILFEPAFFGDDYDMFLFASKQPIKINTEEEIDNYLNQAENGRLIKSMIALFDRNIVLDTQYQSANNDQNERLEQVHQLTHQLKEVEADSTVRMDEINKLTNLLQESEADRSARLDEISKLTENLQESEADRSARLDEINRLTEKLQESESDRANRLGQINELTALLNAKSESEEQIRILNIALQESEADRAARLQQINELTAMLQESETDRAARLSQINELTVLINEMKEK